MSYNGIGLPTPRGTGTSGHIQKNVSSLNNSFSRQGVYERRQELAHKDDRRKATFDARNLATRKIDAGILEHEHKRKIEAKCVELRLELEEAREEAEAAGKPKSILMTDEEIDSKVEALRNRLKRIEENGDNTNSQRRRFVPQSDKHYEEKKNDREERYKSHDVHNMVSAKAKENEKMKEAFESSGRNRGFRNNRRNNRDRSLSPVRNEFRDSRPRSRRDSYGEKDADYRRDNWRRRDSPDVRYPDDHLDYDRDASISGRNAGEGSLNRERRRYDEHDEHNRYKSPRNDERPYHNDKGGSRPSRGGTRRYSIPESLPKAPIRQVEDQSGEERNNSSNRAPNLPPKPQSEGIKRNLQKSKNLETKSDSESFDNQGEDVKNVSEEEDKKGSSGDSVGTEIEKKDGEATVQGAESLA